MEEKLKILKMLENGQISADEAARLLQSVDSSGARPASPVPPPVAPVPPPPPPPPKYEGYASNNGRPGSSHAHAGPSTIEDLGRKFESFARDMAPKVQKFAESAVGAIVGVTDRVSDAFTTGGAPHGGAHGGPAPSHGQHGRPAPSPSPAATTAGMAVINIEKLVEAGTHNELSLSGLNGEVRIKGYNGDKITASLTYKAKRPGAPIELVKLGGKYYLNYEPDDFHQVSIDAYVPERAFGVVKVDGINCRVDCSSLAAGDMRISNENGTLNIANLSANNITAENGNGRFSVSNIAATTASLENLNGPMEATEVDVANLKLTNYNSPVSIIMSGFNRHSDYLWNVETGNAKLSMNMPSLPNLGYHIKAHAAMSEIRLGLTGLQFLINEASLVEARSVSYDHAAKKLKLAAETSNAPLTIN